MTTLRLRVFNLVLVTAALVFVSDVASAQPPAQTSAPAPAAPGGGGGGRGRGGLPGATTEQMQAIADMTTALAPLTAAVTAARNDLATATFTEVRSDAAIKAAVDKLEAAELALATKRAEAFATLQAGPNKLNPDQVAAFIAAGGALPAGRGGAGPGRGGAPGAGAGPGRGAPPAGRGN